MAHFASKAPTVSFVHDYPGFVKTNIGREMTGELKVAANGGDEGARSVCECAA